MKQEERRWFVEATLRKFGYPIRNSLVDAIIERWRDETDEIWHAGVQAGKGAEIAVWIN